MAYSLQTPQTLQEFLAKYAGALDSQGRFIPGKANLNYDDMKAEDVYKLAMGGYTVPSMTGDAEYDAANGGTYVDPQAEVNADWIEDPRAKGWIAQHPKGAAMIGAIGAMVGGGALLGSGGAGSAGGFGAGGSSGLLGGTTGTTGGLLGGGSLGAANAVGAGDLALASMPQAVGAGGTFAGGGTIGGLGGVGGTAAMASLPQVTVTGAKAASALPSLSSMGSSAASALGLSGLTGTSAKNPNDIFTGNGADGVMTNAEAMSYGLSGGDVSTGLLDTAGQWLKDNPTLAKLGGAAIGGLLGGQDSTVSKSSDPWAPAQPYLKANLERNQGMQDYYAKNPFSDQQKTAYQGLLNVLENNQANAPVMAGIANSFMGSNRGLLTGMPQFTSGTKAAPIDWTKYANIGMKG